MVNFMRRIFRWLNKYFMVPVFRMGFGSFVGNPLSGYIMVLKVIGHKTGLLRYVPVNYSILDGNIYCLSGFGKIAHWYKNLIVHPQIEIIMPSGTLSGMAASVTDAEEWLRATRHILKNGGFAGFLAGYNAFTISDEKLREKGAEMIVFRITPTGVYGGMADPGGWLWFWLTVAAALIVALAILT